MSAARIPEPESFLPLKPIELLILTMLTGGDRHGYGIRQDILDHTQGQVTVEAGNLYRHIRTLEEDGLIGEAPMPRSETDERRVYYRLSPLGKRVLAAEMQRLRSLVRIAEDRGIIARGRA
ncbi:MAG: helix-turn-helix transcriptional regulator [Gemmatimonadota bacterium]